ncbi:MAG: hypothetical protein Kow0047_19630 [Anaerolineae bacterium]
MIALGILIAAAVIAWAALRLERTERLPVGVGRDLAAISALAAAVLAYFWRVASGQAYMPADGGDLGSFLLPLYRFAAQSLREGNLPLWNPHLYAGSPFVGDPQTGLLYPFHLAVFLIAPEITFRTMEALSLFHFWWFSAGVYLWLRSLLGRTRGAVWAALFGALAATFSDPMLTHFGNLNLIAVASWLPWTLWAFHQAMRQKSWRWAAAAGLLLGVGTLAGHPQMSIFIGLTLVIDTALQLMSRPRVPVAQRWAVIGRLGLAGGVSLLVGAPTLWPAWELARRSGRAAWDYGQSVDFSLSPAQLVGWLVPAFFGRGPQFHWGPWARVENGYIGILPLLLAVIAIAMRRDRLTWRLTGLAVMSLVLSLGVYALPHGWLTWLIPGLEQLRAPARLLFVTDVAVASLAALGLECLLSTHRRPPALPTWIAYVGWATTGALSIMAFTLYMLLIARQDADPGTTLHIAVALISAVLSAIFALASMIWLRAWQARLVRPATLAWMAIIILLLDVGSAAYNDLSSRNPEAGYQHPEIVAFLRSQPGPWRLDARTGVDALWQPSASLYHGLDDVWGVVNPLVLADYERYWEGMGSRSTRLYDFLNATFVIARKDVVLDWDKFELAFDGDPELNVYRNRRVLPRGQVVYQAIAAANHDQAWEMIHSDGFDPGRQVVVEGGMPLSSSASATAIQAWIPQGPNRVRVDVTLDEPGYLVISQPWYPGWEARLASGEEVPILRANYAFMAIPLPAGTHQVILRYIPMIWWAGLIASAATILVLVVWFVWRPQARRASS